MRITKNVKGVGLDAVISLRNVRLSYCHLWEKGIFNGVQDNKFSTTILLDNQDNEAEQLAILTVIQQIIDQKNKGKSLPPDKYCMRDGQFSDKEGYENCWFVSAKSEVVRIIGKDKSPLVKSDGLIYSGVYVDASISLWFQNNEQGKRINAQLRVVQHHSHGDPLGAGAPTSAQLDGDMDAFDEFMPDIEGDDI